MIYGQSAIDTAIKTEFEHGSPKNNSSDELVPQVSKCHVN